jgi:hypothetical protein
MKITVLDLEDTARKAEWMADFGKAVSQSDLVSLLKSGSKNEGCRAVGCMGWIWRQWLLGSSAEEISGKVVPFVERGLELRKKSSSYHWVALHDLYLLHCAIFACPNPQLREVALEIGDASGDKGAKPCDDGELYAAAWGGMMKYWILDQLDKAVQQAELIWDAYRFHGVLAGSKSIVTPWLKRDWKAFQKAQQKDFERMWKRARSDRWTVKSETETEIVVTTARYQIEHMWCWAHCGLALLANRQCGVEVATDPLWFPAHALSVVPKR